MLIWVSNLASKNSQKKNQSFKSLKENANVLQRKNAYRIYFLPANIWYCTCIDDKPLCTFIICEGHKEKAIKLTIALLAKCRIYYKLYNWIRAWEVLRIKDEPVGHRLNTAHSDHSPKGPKQFVVLWPHATTSSQFPTTWHFSFLTTIQNKGGFLCIKLPLLHHC